jgi:Kef-type K+ transport system membrane component KefB
VRWFLFLALAGLGWAVRGLGGQGLDDPAGSALLSLGGLIIGGVLCGELAVRLRFPKITGYLLLGMVAGPHALGFETPRDAELLRLFEELALGLIALTAGGEFRMSIIRRRLRPLLAITAAQTVGVVLVVAGGLWMLAQMAGDVIALSAPELAAAVLLLGVIAVAVSPSTTIAVMTDLKARGELVETVLGVTILKDLLILLFFTAANALAAAWLRGAGFEGGDLALVAGTMAGSLAVGLALGLMLGLYIAKVGRLVPLTVLLLALASVEIGHGSWIEHLLVCMAAGFAARNAFPDAAGRFLDGLEQSSMPVYVIFFALVGGGLDLGILRAAWLPALAYVVIRMAAVWLTTGVAAIAAGCSEAVRRRAWMGCISQAGLSLGLAARLERDFPAFGASAATVVVAAVVVNQLVGPVLWERAIVASGEAHDGTKKRPPVGRPQSHAS